MRTGYYRTLIGLRFGNLIFGGKDYEEKVLASIYGAFKGPLMV